MPNPSRRRAFSLIEIIVVMAVLSLLAALLFPAFLTGVAKETIQRFSAGDKIGGVRIHAGRMVHYQLGGTPPERFFALQS